MNSTDCHSELQRKTRHVEGGKPLCQGRQSMKLGDRFRLYGHEPSYADFHPQVVSDVENGPQKSKGFQQKHQAQRKTDEVVRYMSNLPSYLERGEKQKDKTFNVGVLEWGRLEKWQYNQRQVQHQSCRSSPSSSNTSSFSTTEGSSSYSSRAHSCSPARQRPHHNVLDSNLNASPCKVYSHAIKTSEKLKSRELGDIPSNYLKLQQSILKTHQCYNKYTGNKPKESKINDSNAENSSDRRRLREPKDQCAASSSKGKSKVQDGELLEEKEKLRGPKNDHAIPHSIDKQQTVVVLIPEEGQEVSTPACSKKSDREAIESSRQSFVQESSCKVNEFSSRASHSCPLSSPQNQNKRPSSIGSEHVSFPFEQNQSMPHPGRFSVSPSRDKNLEQKESIKKSNGSTDVPKPRMDTAASICKVNDAVSQPPNQAGQLSSLGAKSVKFPPEVSPSTPYSGRSSASPIRDKKLDERKSTKKVNSPAKVPKPRLDVEDSKVRHPSPIRRLSFSIGRIGRNSSSKDSCTSQNIHPIGDISSRGAETSALSADSCCDKSNAASKGRSSPLRRLIDPFLKPRAVSSDDSNQRASAQIMEMGCKLSVGSGEASALHSVKVKLDLGSCKSIVIDQPGNLGKCGSTMVQALLQVAVKNGLPLFTFAVDNSSDILAATMKKLSSSRRDGNNFIYTFFAVHEMRKKNGNWFSHGSKEKNHDYISDIVGQMKVSDVLNTVPTRENAMNQCTMREFVLLAANTREADKKTSDLQTNDELAAIVVNLPERAAKSLNGSGPKQCYSSKIPTRELEKSSQEACGQLDCKDMEGSRPFSESIDLLGLTVILPGGDHGAPIHGKPSPLIERWRKGGVCDCGGWDIGCQLKVIASQAQLNEGCSSNNAHSTPGKFQLYSQEEMSDGKPIFSLSPFKDGIYSVEFNSSLKLLQAFSICIAVLNGLKPAEFSHLNRFFDNKSAAETTLSATVGAKASNRDLEDMPSSFIARPPGSPVARA